MLLNLRNIRKSYGTQDILKGINIDINEGERIGIVGRNGAGKTTLANIIFGSLKYDEGSIIRSSNWFKTGYLLQSTSYKVNTVEAISMQEDAAYSGDFSKTAGRLGLKGVQSWDEKRLKGLSGGERTRAALAEVFATRPDFLILDEPTNHLDFQGVEWLADELAKFRGSILVISHDRYFLDRIAGRIVEIDDGKAVSYSGNYSFYRAEKKRRYEEQLHQYIEQEKRKDKIEEEIERVKMWSAKAHRDSTNPAKTSGNKMGAKEYCRLSAKRMDKRVKSQIKRLERMKTDGIKKPEKELELNFYFNDAVKRGRRVLEAQNLSKSYGSRVLFRKSSFFVQRGEKVGLVGPNGCGKTTLVRIIMGMENSDEGEIWLSPSASLTYISQDVGDLDSDETPLEVIKALPGKNTGEARTVLASMGIGESMLNKPVRNMSLGERTRIKIASAILHGKDFLILDEPTNHLDLYSREQLEDALESFEGTVLIISHDRYMLEKVCDKILAFGGDKLLRYEGGFGEWREKAVKQMDTACIKARFSREEVLVLENRLSAVISRLGGLPKEHPDYEKLDAEYRELIAKKRSMS